MEVFFLALGLFVTDHCPRLKVDMPALRAVLEAHGATIDPEEYQQNIDKRAAVASQVRALATKPRLNCRQAYSMFGPRGAEVPGLVSHAHR